MGLIKKSKEKKKNNTWELTDEIIKIKDIIYNIKPEFSSRFNIDDTYVCMRDMGLNNTSIFIKHDDMASFKNNDLIYNKNNNLINVSELKKYVIKKDAYSAIANRSVPPAVNIKLVYECKYMDIELYVEKTFILQQDASLFRDLLNFQSLKDRHNLK